MDRGKAPRDGERACPTGRWHMKGARMDRGCVSRVEPSMSPRGERVSEGIILATVCLAPWAFGSVDAWAELALEASIALLTILRAFVGRGVSRGRLPICIPSLALGGLALVGVA